MRTRGATWWPVAVHFQLEVQTQPLDEGVDLLIGLGNVGDVVGKRCQQQANSFVGVERPQHGGDHLQREAFAKPQAEHALGGDLMTAVGHGCFSLFVVQRSPNRSAPSRATALIWIKRSAPR